MNSLKLNLVLSVVHACLMLEPSITWTPRSKQRNPFNLALCFCLTEEKKLKFRAECGDLTPPAHREAFTVQLIMTYMYV